MSLNFFSENIRILLEKRNVVSFQWNRNKGGLSMETKNATKNSLLDRFLNTVERVCNKLPPPAILFCILFVITAVVGAICTQAGFALENPASHKIVTSQNFFTTAGIQWLLTTLVKNFTGFAPLGLVITMTLAIGFCEESGMLAALLRRCMKGVPPSLVPFIVAFLGVCGNIASDTAMVVIPPLAAVAYIGVRKHPVVGMMVGFAGAEAGFGANLMIAGTDSLLQGLTNQAIDGFFGKAGVFAVDVTCNWYFMFASTFLCAFIIALVSIKIVEPRFGVYDGPGADEELGEVKPIEVKGLNRAALVVVAYILVLVAGFFAGVLSKDGHTFVGSPLLKGLIPLLFVMFSLAGLTYGFTTGSFKTIKDVNKAMVHQMSGMGAFVVFCFFCGQFQALFSWTHLGTLLAIGGADFLKNVGFTGLPMCVIFILITSLVNIFMSSGSAKWAIFAPIFIPMFMLLGYHPGFTQLLYRLGDSPTNCFTPMNPYLWMILSVAQEKYMPKAAIGTLVSNLIPIAVCLQIAWIIFLIVWMTLGLPIGPGVEMALPAGVL